MQDFILRVVLQKTPPAEIERAKKFRAEYQSRKENHDESH